MKKWLILTLFFLFCFGYTEAAEKKYLNVGADPVERDFCRKHKLQTFSLPEDVFVATTAKSRKVSVGWLHKDEEIGWVNKEKSEYVICTCGNSVKFLQTPRKTQLEQLVEEKKSSTAPAKKEEVKEEEKEEEVVIETTYEPYYAREQKPPYFWHYEPSYGGGYYGGGGYRGYQGGSVYDSHRHHGHHVSAPPSVPPSSSLPPPPPPAPRGGPGPDPPAHR